MCVCHYIFYEIIYKIWSLNQNKFQLILGVTIEYIVGSFLPWYLLAFISAMIPTFALVVSFFLPESPSWLLSRGLTEQCRAALKSLRGDTCDVESELNALVEFNQRNNMSEKLSLKETIANVIHPSALKPLFILGMYFFIYQFSGVNPVTFYAVEIFEVRCHLLL